MKFKRKNPFVEAFQFGVDTAPMWFTDFVKRTKSPKYIDSASKKEFYMIQMEGGIVPLVSTDYVIYNNKSSVTILSEEVFNLNFEK